jgi:hypothetical protein
LRFGVRYPDSVSLSARFQASGRGAAAGRDGFIDLNFTEIHSGFYMNMLYLYL